VREQGRSAPCELITALDAQALPADIPRKYQEVGRALFTAGETLPSSKLFVYFKTWGTAPLPCIVSLERVSKYH
jgi:hypothetical protein